MARTRTLTQLIAEVRDRADIEGAQHITDTQITRYINQSGAALHAMMVEYGEDYFITEAAAPISALTDNRNTISLPSAAYKVVAVAAQINGVGTPIERWDWRQYHPLVTVGVAPASTRYRIVNNDIIIVPGLAVGTNVSVFYVPAYVDLSAGGDTYDGRDGWEEWVVWDAAIKCMVKEETDTREAVLEREQVLARIKSQMKARDLANPHEVVSVGNPWSYEVD